jgi:hypothetical protein
MSESKHTPGPWEYYEHDYSIGVKMPMGNKTRFDAHPYAAFGGYAQEDYGITRANARLTAAAPDLLDAINAILSNRWGTPEMWEALEKCKAAKAKAEAQS